MFDSRPNGNADIFIINSQGGQPQRLTTESSEDIVPIWSRYGQAIYFNSNRGGSSQIWKMPAGGGTPTQVTRNGGFEGTESADGQWLYYTRERGEAAIWRVAVAGGEEIPVLITVQMGTAACGRYETAACILRAANPLYAQSFASTIFPRDKGFLFS